MTGTLDKEAKCPFPWHSYLSVSPLAVTNDVLLEIDSRSYSCYLKKSILWLRCQQNAITEVWETHWDFVMYRNKPTIVATSSSELLLNYLWFRVLVIW